MKKILVLSFILLFATAAMAQDVYFYYGWPGSGTGDAGDPIPIGYNKDVDIEVYFMGTTGVGGGSYNAPLAINNAYADYIDTLQCYFDAAGTVINWDSKNFGNYEEDKDLIAIAYGTDGVSTWDSWGNNGIIELFPPYDSPPFVSMVPEVNLHYMIHTNDDPALIGESTCALVNGGWDPFQEWPLMSDTSGTITYNAIWEGACYFFSPNQPVEFVEGDAVPGCTYVDFSMTATFWDPDGDVPDITVNVPLATYTVEEVADPANEDAAFFIVTVDFDMENFCGTCFNDDVIITAVDPNNAEEPSEFNAGNLTIVGQMTASMDPALYIWPGLEDWMPIYLDTCGDCFCLGGFVFSIEWDSSILTVTDVERGAILMGGEYWNVNMGVDGAGTLRVTFINDLDNQTEVEPICGIDAGEPLFRVKFLLSAAFQYPVNHCVPICFMYDLEGEDHYDYNNVADAEGYHVWFNDGCDDAPDSSQYGTLDLDLVCGNIKVLDEHNIVLGDMNLNGYEFEAGDVVVLANYLIDPINNPLNLRQMYASDVNDDDIQGSIADLIYMINTVNGYDGFGKLAPLDVIATVSMPAVTAGNVDVSINSEAAVGGARVEIAHAGVELGVPTVDGMDIEYNDNGEVMTVIVYNMDSQAFAAGTNTLFTIPVMGEGAVSINDVQVADSRGALLDARSEVAAAIPEFFAVNQNFPNPFNAKTSIAFGLPTSADVTINIFNVAGQLVESMELGNVNAGNHSVVWDASDVASGVYFYKVSAGDFTETLKMTLLK